MFKKSVQKTVPSAVELKKIREKERKRVHMMFKRCWAAFQKTDYGRILTDNPDLRKHLFNMLEESFTM
jgi:hypothetical protein